MFAITPFILGITLAEREGATRDDALKVGLVQGMVGLNPLGILLARNMVESAKPVAAPPKTDSAPKQEKGGTDSRTASEKLEELLGDIASDLKGLRSEVGALKRRLDATDARLETLAGASDQQPIQQAP